jgi:hypothetical protein
MPIYYWGMPPTNGQAWWSTTNSTSSSTTWYPVTTSATGVWYTDSTPTSSISQYQLPLYLSQQNSFLLQQQQAMAMLAAQQNRYQPMGQLNGGGQRQLQQLAAPAVLRRPRLEGEERARRVDEQLAAYQRRAEEAVASNDQHFAEVRQRAEEVAARRRAADERAFELLREHLSEAQLATLAAEGYFIVIGQRTGRRYRIRTVSGIAGNIEELAGNDNRPTHRLCCHMEHVIPTADHFLAQKLMLESAEDDFLRIANRNRA